jgi:hypothetical protein
MNMFIFIVFFTTWIVANTDNESLFSLACSYVDKTCSLYEINIDQSRNRAVSNEGATWNQTNTVQSAYKSAVGESKSGSYIRIAP